MSKREAEETAEEETERWWCFLCGGEVDILRSKRGKPYFICDPCGVQAFVRRKKGINLLKELQKKNEKSPLFSSSKVLAMVNSLSHLKDKLSEIRGRKGILNIFPDKELELAEKTLKKEISKLGECLSALSGKGNS
jgi:hypothetical protein